MTDDAKFTKGPWSVSAPRLITAAPDLYEALYECATLLSAFTRPTDEIAVAVMSMARDALAKAVSP